MSSRYWPSGVPRLLNVPERTLWHNLEESAARYPEKPALIFFDNTIRFRELKDQAERIAGWLQQHGVASHDRVVIYMQNCPQFIIAAYGVFRANAVVVPINPMNRRDELLHCLIDCAPLAIVCSAELAETVASAVRDLPSPQPVPSVIVTSYADAASPLAVEIVRSARSIFQLLAQNHEVPAGHTRWEEALASAVQPTPHTAEPDDLALLPYTSGTTGMPKGCMHTHRSLMHNAMFGVWTGKTSETINLGVTPMFHISGMMDSVLGGIYDGATTVVMLRWNRELAGRLISRHRVTHWTTVPTMVIDLFGGTDLREFDLSSVRAIIGGGTAMPQPIAERLLNEFGLTFIEGYGLTETAAPTHCNPPQRCKPECLGIPIFGVDSRIIDPVSLQELPDGQVGEIVTHGPMLFKGYWRQPEATADAFVMLDGKPFLRTGDLGRRDEEGYFYIADRLKRMINASGYKVWPSEIELLLFKCPLVRDVCVVGAKDSYRGETVKAVVVLRDDAKAHTTGQDIVDWARQHMAAYKVPRIVQLVDDLPKSSSGKVLWRILQEQENGSCNSLS